MIRPLMRALNAGKALASCCRGATAVEYGFILSLVVIALIAGLSAMADANHEKWDGIANKVSAVEP